MRTVGAITAARIQRSLFIEQLADEAVLREAWYRVQRGGKAGGVDGTTVDTFRPRADQRIRQLRDALLADTYQTSPVRRVQIPKPSGGVRLLGLPTITDRIAQTAAALVLHDRVAAQFSDRSFAYRPFLGPRRAAVFLRTTLASAQWVVTADIEKFFDNVEHRVLSDQLRNIGVDDGGVRLVLRWLLAPVDDRGRWYQPVKGLPQGSPVAPVLANLYLTGFDTALEAEGFAHVRYADDFVILGKDEHDAQRALRYVSTYLSSRLHLRIKPAKTQMAPASEGFTFVGFRFTRDTWTVPPESIERFKEAVTTLLTDTSPLSLPVSAKSHNDIVRGWRHYYGGNSSEMYAQLAEIDAWRANECRGYLARTGREPDAAAVWFERLVESSDGHPPVGAYAASPEAEPSLADTQTDQPDPWHQRPGGDRRGRDRVFSTVRQVRDAEIGRKQLPVVLDDGWLRVPTFGGFVTKSQGLVVVRRKKQVIFECAFEDVSCLTVEASGVALSTTVVEECAHRGIPIAFCRISGKPIARIVSARSPLDAPLVHHQLRARVGRSGTPLVQAVIGAKLANQRALLLYHSKYRGRSAELRARLVAAAQSIEHYRLDVERVTNTPMRKARQSLFLAEARAWNPRSASWAAARRSR
jgi:group II intron reverse transcriptase/maturase